MTEEEEANIERQAYLKYFDVQLQQKQVTMPNFVTFQKKFLYLHQQRITKKHAFALATYLGAVREIPEKRVFRLIIDSCDMKDDAFAIILDGIHQ